MALVRVYCGLAAAEPPRPAATRSLTVALVDDAGRILDICDVDDHPQGYAFLSALLAERASGPYSVAIAADSDRHLVSRLLAAAGWALAFADDRTTDDYADRFADELGDASRVRPPQRRALGLARALHAGVFTATTLPPPAELADLKPVLAADGALANGRYGAAVALREVLRELYPAALRAYPDPADPVALAVMEALPEPGALASVGGARGRDAAAADTVTAQLAAGGVADAGTIAEAITALRVAIAETPRRAGLGRALAPTIAATVRRAVAAVRACDDARAALIHTLAERVHSGVVDTPAGSQAGPSAAPSQPSPPPTAAPYAPSPAAAAASPAAPVGAVAAPGVPARAEAPAAAAAPAWTPSRPVSAPTGTRPVSSPPPPPGITPIAEPPPARTSLQPAAHSTTERPSEPFFAEVRVPTPRPAPEGPPPGSRAGWPTSPPADDWASVTPTPEHAPAATAGPGHGARTDGWAGPDRHDRQDRQEPDGRSERWRTAGDSSDQWRTPRDSRADDRDTRPRNGWAASRDTSPPPPPPAREPAAVTPPWQSDDLRPPEPPALRLVEPTLPDELREDLRQGGWSDPPPLRLVEPDEGIPRSVPPVDAGRDDADLLIFAQARSAWFSDPTGDSDWNQSVDTAWRAAEQATRPEVGDQTQAGLPRRVPHANLIPGSPPTDHDRPLRVVRDPASIAAHTSGYFNGWRRGQEVGGYPLGTRTSRQSGGAWDFARDHHAS